MKNRFENKENFQNERHTGGCGVLPGLVFLAKHQERKDKR